MRKKKQASKIPVPTEYSEQCSIFRRAQLYIKRYPELRFLTGSLSGVRLTVGTAMKCKNAGCLVRGVPDLFLPINRGGYSGLFIELKRVKGSKILPEQNVWATMLTSQGYRHEFCYGADAAWAVIVNYLSGKEG